ncbi:Uncharacterised protein [Streptococcus pneumoniae]|nr:Uncharacterised protein [Streptococcus pneumoniae]CJB44305.1 Uncharacterised protein [Streptococcus pneumoniae]CKJ09880.1 Uncharacterised protein [Streptococcus pneumoniae]COM16432.1 Uncharacterised protein [Streptococcus pneumoniae]
MSLLNILPAKKDGIKTKSDAITNTFFNIFKFSCKLSKRSVISNETIFPSFQMIGIFI